MEKLYEKNGFIGTYEEVSALDEDDLEPREIFGTRMCLFARHGLNFPSIFGSAIKDPMDFGVLEADAAKSIVSTDAAGSLIVYVTGLTPALVAVINVCRLMHKDLILMHFDRDSGVYKAQLVY